MMRVYSIFDRKLREYGPPLVQRNDDAVCREVAAALAKGGDTMHSRYPADFDIFFLGFFDQESGQIVTEEVPMLVENFANLLPQEG